MISPEGSDAIGEELLLFGLNEGGADADALLVAAHGVEGID